MHMITRCSGVWCHMIGSILPQNKYHEFWSGFGFQISTRVWPQNDMIHFIWHINILRPTPDLGWFLETKSRAKFSVLFSFLNFVSSKRVLSNIPYDTFRIVFSFFKYFKSYATIMLQNEKWKFAMEQYYTSRNEPIPWKSQSYEVKFSVPS